MAGAQTPTALGGPSMSKTETQQRKADDESLPDPQEDALTESVVRDLYLDRGWSRRAIAERLGVAPGAVKSKLRDCGILRPEEIEWSEDTLYGLYIEDRRTIGGVAEELGSYRDKVRRHLAHYNIQKTRKQATRDYHRPSETPANFYTNGNGYERIKDSSDKCVSEVGHHQLVAIAHGADPFTVFSGGPVHHKNGVKWDNRIENLKVYDSHGDHINDHWHPRELTERIADADDTAVKLALERAGYEDAAGEI